MKTWVILLITIISLSLTTALQVGIDNPNLPRANIISSEQGTTYFPTSVVVETGTVDSGNITSLLSAFDGDSLNISETVGTPATLVYVNFTNVKDFDYGATVVWYDGSDAHQVDICLYNYDSSAWDCYWEVLNNNHWEIVSGSVFNSESYIQSGIVQVKYEHSMAGNINHDLFIDYIILSDGGAVLLSNDHDSLSGRNDILTNHPNSVDIFCQLSGCNMTGILNVNDGLDYNKTDSIVISSDDYSDFNTGNGLQWVVNQAGNVVASIGVRATNTNAGGIMFSTNNGAGTNYYPLYIGSNGNVGIGGGYDANSEPSYALGVNGQSQFQGGFRVGTETGSPVMDGDQSTFSRIFFYPESGNYPLSVIFSPSGTEDRALFQINNDDDLNNRGRLLIDLDGANAMIYTDSIGGGTAPTSLKFGIGNQDDELAITNEKVSINGDFSIVGSADFYDDNSISSQPDILYTSSSFEASEWEAYYSIDSINSATARCFHWGNNDKDTSSYNELMVLCENGTLDNYNNIKTPSLELNGTKITDWSDVNITSSGGGNPFDQYLNTTNNVEFQNVTIGDMMFIDMKYYNYGCTIPDYDAITDLYGDATDWTNGTTFLMKDGSTPCGGIVVAGGTDWMVGTLDQVAL